MTRGTWQREPTMISDATAPDLWRGADIAAPEGERDVLMASWC